jgi:hypothetical protein
MDAVERDQLAERGLMPRALRPGGAALLEVPRRPPTTGRRDRGAIAIGFHDRGVPWN